jgi:citrate lyase beta subunit
VTHGTRGGAELASATAARATHWQGSITRSSSPRLLVGASIVEACRLGGAATMDGWCGAGRRRKQDE